MKKVRGMLHAIYLGTVFLVVMTFYVFLENKKAYGKGEPMPLKVSMGWWIADTSCITIIALSSFHSIWYIPIDTILPSVVGLIVFLIGLIIQLAGMIEFCSIRRISGMDTSKLITTGIYKWSRNPQFLGWYLMMLGISIFGRSGYALLITAITILACHYYIVKVEEPYLQRVFGEEYLKYKSRTPRYFGLLKK
ncbi:MAG: methyltransferase family protein [Candidatus Asgardarchaeia archaeon]